MYTVNTENLIRAIYPPPPDAVHFTEKGGTITYVIGEGDRRSVPRSYPVGDLVTDYANLLLDKRNKQQEFVSLCCEIEPFFSTPKHDSEKLFSVAIKYGKTMFAWTIVLLCFEARHRGSAAPGKYFRTRLKKMAQMCKSYIDGVELTTTKAGISLDARILTDDSGKLIIEYSSIYASSILYYHLLRLQELGQQPNICEVCGRAFMPVSKSNEKYCRKKYSDGRTCYDLAMLTKEKEDPFQNLYRKAYKTMSQRASRAKGYKNIQERNKQWRKEAKAKQQECRANNDLAGFTQWIEDSLKK